MSASIELARISFDHPGAGTVLFEDLTLRLSDGWTGIVGANGAGKTTLLELVTGRLTPSGGRIVGVGDAVLCSQRTDDPPAELASLLRDEAAVARRLCGRLGVEDDWFTRWSTLSHGERKRAQIATALWRSPTVLALDEPTNHVDAGTRDLVLRSLSGFRGVGLLVSHDRTLLDGLCRQCLFLEAGKAAIRPGNFTEASAQEELDRETRQRAHDQARREQKRLRQTEVERRQEAARADRRRSKRKIGHKDHDAKSRIDAARVSGKDGQAGRLVRQMGGRMEQAADRVRTTRIGRRRSLGMTMRGEPARCDALWRTDPRALVIGGERRLELPEMVIRPGDRIGVRGPNGAGKSTLVRHIVSALVLPADRIVHLPQEIDRAGAAAILETLHRLPPDRRGDVLAAIDCLGSDPERVLETEAPSPGETRKLVLALGLARAPHLIVMDEPTNHLDLPSIECLESALDECQCALLLVSHDEAFLGRLARTYWTIAGDRLEIASTDRS